MQPLRASGRRRRGAHLRGVLTDIDDTLTTEGAITPDALAALADLQRAGLHVVADHRPARWAGANRSRCNGRSMRSWRRTARWRSPAPPMAAAQALRAGRARALATTRACSRWRSASCANSRRATISRDSGGRETDIAIDHSEFAHLSRADRAGRRADAQRGHERHRQLDPRQRLVSATHKLSGARWIVRELLGCDLDAELDRWVYVGDSTNDVLMFQHFAHSVGVANIRRFVSTLAHLPRYVAQANAARLRGSGGGDSRRSRRRQRTLKTTGLARAVIAPGDVLLTRSRRAL